MAKILAGEFLELPPRDQADFIREALSRVTPPPANAPSVCHLDTGVNRGHPLLEFALAEEHLLAVDPTWLASDGHPQQHGTGMAGLALYGCLTELLNCTGAISLQHRLESVKILPDHGAHDPDCPQQRETLPDNHVSHVDSTSRFPQVPLCHLHGVFQSPRVSRRTLIDLHRDKEETEARLFQRAARTFAYQVKGAR